MRTFVYTPSAVERAALAVRWVIPTRLPFPMHLLYLDDSGSANNAVLKVLSDSYESARALDRQRGLLILDKSARETTLQNMAREFRTFGTRWGVVRNLADTPLFIDSSASRVIQLADHVAYAVFRRYESGDTQYFDLIASKFDTADGVVHGLVHKQYSDPKCMCLACVTRRAGDSVREPGASAEYHT